MHSTAYEKRPTWELVDMFPYQGSWTPQDYLALETNKLVELTDGYLEFLPIPDELHQWITMHIYQAVVSLLRQRKRGVAVPAPFRVRVAAGRFREPDVSVLWNESDERRSSQYWHGADLVVEVVSPDNPERDYWKKRQDYADARIGEYWIVDPQKQVILVLKLEGDNYVDHQEYSRGQTARSISMPDLKIDVDECFRAGF